jgi:hypothetical protein
MSTTVTELSGEEQRLRQRLTELQQEVRSLEARLAEIAREQERQRRPRSVRAAVRLVADLPPKATESAAVRVVSAAAEQRPVDYLAVLRDSARGTALFAPEPDEERPEAVLLVRSDSQCIAALGKDPDVEFRAGLFEVTGDGPVVVAVLARIGAEEPDNLYETWVSEEQGEAEEMLRRLAKQQEVVVRLHGDDCRPERTLRAPNSLRAFAREALGRVVERRSWSSDAFHQARAAVYKRYPQPLSLWRALKASRPG